MYKIKIKRTTDVGKVLAVQPQDLTFQHCAALACHPDSKFYVDSSQLLRRQFTIDAAISIVLSRSIQLHLLYWVPNHTAVERPG